MSDFVTEVIPRREILKEYKGTEKEILIPEGITEIKMFLFKESDIVSVTFPKSLKEIEGFAFENCKNLQEINFPETPIEVQSAAFKKCDSLEKITYPLIVPGSIGNGRFDKCTNLKTVIYPVGSLILDASDFRGCENLQELFIPESINEYQYDHLSLSSSHHPFCKLTSIYVNPKNNSFCMDGVLFKTKDKKKLLICISSAKDEVEIPEGIEEVYPYAFEGKDKITSLVLPNSLETIGFCAFKNCKALTTVVIPQNVASIGEEAFIGCDNLKNVTVYKGTEIEENAFPATCKIKII